MANRRETQWMLDLTCAMWDDPLVYFYQDLEFAPEGIPSIMLLGPSSRQDILEYKWRAFARYYLRQIGFTGAIYIPEPRENDWRFKETFPMPIVKWESLRALSCTLAFLWHCRHPIQLPGRVTGTELAFLSGMAHADPERFKQRLIYGHPPGAWKVKSDDHWASIAEIEPFYDLETMCQHACARVKLITGT